MSVDPKELTPAQKTALMNVHDYAPARTKGGYGRRPESFVPLATAEKLKALRLARIDISSRGQRLLVTGEGFNTWSVMMERQDERRKA